MDLPSPHVHQSMIALFFSELFFCSHGLSTNKQLLLTTLVASVLYVIKENVDRFGNIAIYSILSSAYNLVAQINVHVEKLPQIK